jgi:putative SOS response-associated peptidase YedK
VCNLYRLDKNVDAVRRLFADLQIPLTFPEGIPNFQPRDVRITETAPIVRLNRFGEAELVERRWSWPAPGGKPVFNMRSDGREFSKGRCLVLADGFYEFTAAKDPQQKRKDCWLFTPAREVAIAGLLKESPGLGEAFTLLTVAPGPDIIPYHQRGVAVLTPEKWRSWLDCSTPSLDLLAPSEAGSFAVNPRDRTQ